MSIEPGMLVTVVCSMRCLCPRCCSVVTSCILVESTFLLLSLVLPMCILISCSSVLCVMMALGMFDCESYVVLDQCDEPPPCLCVWWCNGVFYVF